MPKETYEGKFKIGEEIVTVKLIIDMHAHNEIHNNKIRFIIVENDDESWNITEKQLKECYKPISKDANTLMSKLEEYL